MRNSIFAVVLISGQDKGYSLLKESYQNVFQLQDNIILVAGKHLSSDIAKVAALTKDQEEIGVRGVVFKLNEFYTGFTRQSLWEWLENVEETQ